MRKISILLSMLLALTVTTINAQGYGVRFTGTKSNDRPMNYVKVESASYGVSNYNLTESEKLQLYVDATDRVTLKVGAGDVVTPTVGYGGDWMHVYVYVDADGDAAFTAGVENDGYTPTGDLVSYSAYNADPDNGGKWCNSEGVTGNNNTRALPTFKAPEALGTYRMRFKIDWNSIDPQGNEGNADGTNTLKVNRGSIIDVMLEVAEPQEGYVEQLFNATSIAEGQFAKGTAWYTLQIGANGFAIADNGTADHIALESFISDASDDAQLWAFVGDNTNGYKLYNKQAGVAKVLAAPTKMSSNTGGSSYPILVDAEAVPSGYTDMWMFTTSDDLGTGDTYFYMYEKGYPSNKVNNRENKLAFWNGGADAGSTLNIRLGQAEYSVTALTGEWTETNAAGTWASGWKSTAVPHVCLSETQNRKNIAGYNENGDLQLYTCLANATVNGVYIATYSLTTNDKDYVIAGYSFDFVSSGTADVTVTPNGGSAVTAGSSEAATVSVENSDENPVLTFDVTSGSNMFANTSNFCVKIVRKAPVVEPQEDVFITKQNGIPYRIPAIAMAKNGDLIAVADYRHSGADIGVVNNGRIDLHARISKNNGESWGDKFAIVEGKGAASPDFMHVGFGDPAIVADRESNRVLVLSCAGNVSFQSGTRNNHQNIARFYSDDNGATWSEPVDIAPEIYAMWDNSNHGPVMAMFVGSGKIHQSRYVKVNDYYRLYCAVLLKNKNATYTNFVLYSDDFGGTWDVLGGVNNAPIPSGGDEPKVEELPNGNVVISSRISGGRDFNIYTFTDAEKAEGSWGTRATSNANNNGVVALGNSTNGEIMIFPAIRNEDGENVWIALQSVPFGSGRTNVGIYYKELASELDYNTPANFAKDWDGRHQASFIGSAYSTMCFQSDSTIAFLYEEETYGAGYTIVYKNYSLEQITDGAYTISGDITLPETDQTVSEETKALIVEAKELLQFKGLGYPTGDARSTFEAAIAAAEANPTEAAGITLSTAIDAYYSATEIELPEAGKIYTFTAVWGENEYYIYNNNGTLAVAARGEEELPEEAQFVCEYDEAADYKFQFKTLDGAYYLAYPTIGGKSWLDGESVTGLEAESSQVTMFNVTKILAGGNVEATNEALFGLIKMDGYRGWHNSNLKDELGPIVVMHSALAFDGANAPFYNNNYTSAFRIEDVEGEPEVALEVVSVSPEAGDVEALTEVVVTFNAEVALDETKSIKLVAEIEEEEENGITPIEAYVGNWDVYSEWVGYGNYTVTGTIEAYDYQGMPALLCTGFSLYAEDGYNDMFLMLYNSEDGSVTLPAQNMQPFEYEGYAYDVVLYLTSSTEPKLYGGNLIGNIVDGNIVFENSPGNNNVADSWMMYATDLGNLTYFNSLTWTPATAAAAPAKTPVMSKLNVVDAAIKPIAGGMMKANVVEYNVTAQVNADDATQLVIAINDELADGTYKLVIEEGAVVTADGQTSEAMEIVYNVAKPEAPAVDYTPRHTGTKTRNDRSLLGVELESATFGVSSYELTQDELTQDYTDATENAVFMAAPGEEVTVSVSAAGSWVHFAVYVDEDADGFTSGIEEGSDYAPAGDLVAYSFYNNGSGSDESGWNSVGDVITGNDRNKPAIPAFTVPTEAGTYRMRIQQDWCSIDPMGDADGKFGDFKANGGQIIDVILEVAVSDGIENVVINENSVIYDLTGRKVNNATKGIYIINGKKVFIK